MFQVTEGSITKCLLYFCFRRRRQPEVLHSSILKRQPLWLTICNHSLHSIKLDLTRFVNLQLDLNPSLYSSKLDLTRFVYLSEKSELLLTLNQVGHSFMYSLVSLFFQVSIHYQQCIHCLFHQIQEIFNRQLLI